MKDFYSWMENQTPEMQALLQQMQQLQAAQGQQGTAGTPQAPQQQTPQQPQRNQQPQVGQVTQTNQPNMGAPAGGQDVNAMKMKLQQQINQATDHTVKQQLQQQLAALG